MASSSEPRSDAPAEVAPDAAPDALLMQTTELLRAKDDTSRFVGLALLKTVLDTRPEVRNDTSQIVNLWQAISTKFVDRLLRAHQSAKVNSQEAKDMVDISISVLHKFSVLLPEEARSERRFMARVPALMCALISSSPESTVLALQILLTISSCEQGGLAVLRSDDLASLLEVASEQTMALDVLSAAVLTASSQLEQDRDLQEMLAEIMSRLVVSFRGTDSVTLLQFVAGLFPRLSTEALPPTDKWLASITEYIKALVAKRPTSVGRAAYTEAAAALLQAYPVEAPTLLFKDERINSSEQKPFSYLFVQLLLIDIRSSFPSLLAKLNSEEYPRLSRRLSAAFDVVSTFIGFLVRMLDGEELSMAPDLLLMLRKNIAETLSLTIEYLRDRWDASVAGVAGLHSEARSGTSVTSAGTHLTLTWESMKDDVSADPLILASLRMLSLWIREDENDNLRKESAGLMDLFVELYQQSAQAQLDFRYPILLALTPILQTEDGMDAFMAQSGWQRVCSDLIAIARDGGMDASRGIELVRVLLCVVDSDSTIEPPKEWMNVIDVVASTQPTTLVQPLAVEFQIALLQLAVALLERSSPRVQKQYLPRLSALVGLRNELAAHVQRSFQGSDAAEFEESLDDALMSLENLR